MYPIDRPSACIAVRDILLRKHVIDQRISTFSIIVDSLLIVKFLIIRSHNDLIAIKTPPSPLNGRKIDLLGGHVGRHLVAVSQGSSRQLFLDLAVNIVSEHRGIDRREFVAVTLLGQLVLNLGKQLGIVGKKRIKRTSSPLSREIFSISRSTTSVLRHRSGLI